MNKKVPIIAVIGGGAAALAVAAFVFGSGTNAGDPSPVADSFTEAVYVGDYKGIFAMMPESFQKRSIESTMSMSECETEDEALEYQGKNLTAYMETLNSCFGEEWSMEYQTGEAAYLSKDELKELNLTIKMMGVEGFQADKAANIPVDISFSGLNGVEGSTQILVPAVHSRSGWKLGQYINVADPADAQVYNMYFGDLMDGFTVEGVFDEDGNRIEIDEEGYQMKENADGTYTATDENGNTRHYDENKKLIKVTDPDGKELDVSDTGSPEEEEEEGQ